ncbi:hypothetical protein R69746_08686 [Paraburkholderia aspalathi]|nr:hypothetical protein R69746_08686 [Paraburkholderia aspalathi]
MAQGLPHIEQQPIEFRTRSQLCSVLCEYRPDEIVGKPWLFQNLEYAALLRNWPDLQRPAKLAIIQQLEVENYRTELLNEPQIATLKNEIEAFASDNWYGPWSFSGLTVDVTFARMMLGEIMSLAIDKETKTKLFNSYPQLFDRKTVYHRERVLAICTVLSNIVTSGPLAEKLSAIYHATIGNHDPLRNLLSSERLWVSLWKRDPWTDYGRSDQMFSCTGLGDYAADSGPSALADIAVNKLDVWDHNELVGRVNLCLVRDFSGQPYLLVDSLEGSDRILKVQAKAQDLMAAIRNFGAPFGEGNVLLNCRTSYNNTPRRFVEYAMSGMKYLPEYKYLRRYTSKTSLGRDADNLKRAYFEAFHTNEDGLVFCAEL